MKFNHFNPRIVKNRAILLSVVAALLVGGCASDNAENIDAAAPDNTAQESNADSLEAEQNDNTEDMPSEEVMIPATNYYKISTPQGDMVIRLYDETPGHRDNFKKLVAQGFYNDTKFHRVIQNFMIQGGDPNSKDDDPMNDGQGGPGYTIPAEFEPGLFHKKGALAAARTGDNFNPERRSSGSQFYIVQGQTWEADMLDRFEQQIAAAVPGFEFSDEARSIYMNQGGTPGLDMQYTVFGEVVAGFDVLDSIAAANTPRKRGEPAHPNLTDRPPTDITMSVVAVEDYQEAGQ